MLLPSGADIEAPQEEQLQALSPASFLRLLHSVLEASRSSLAHAGVISAAVHSVPGQSLQCCWQLRVMMLPSSQPCIRAATSRPTWKQFRRCFHADTARH